MCCGHVSRVPAFNLRTFRFISSTLIALTANMAAQQVAVKGEVSIHTGDGGHEGAASMRPNSEEERCPTARGLAPFNKSPICPAIAPHLPRYPNCLSDLECTQGSFCCLSRCHGVTKCYNPQLNLFTPFRNSYLLDLVKVEPGGIGGLTGNFTDLVLSAGDSVNVSSNLTGPEMGSENSENESSNLTETEFGENSSTDAHEPSEVVVLKAPPVARELPDVTAANEYSPLRFQYEPQRKLKVVNAKKLRTRGRMYARTNPRFDEPEDKTEANDDDDDGGNDSRNPKEEISESTMTEMTSEESTTDTEMPEEGSGKPEDIDKNLKAKQKFKNKLQFNRLHHQAIHQRNYGDGIPFNGMRKASPEERQKTAEAQTPESSTSDNVLKFPKRLVGEKCRSTNSELPRITIDGKPFEEIALENLLDTTRDILSTKPSVNITGGQEPVRNIVRNIDVITSRQANSDNQVNPPKVIVDGKQLDVPLAQTFLQRADVYLHKPSYQTEGSGPQAPLKAGRSAPANVQGANSKPSGVVVIQQEVMTKTKAESVQSRTETTKNVVEVVEEIVVPAGSCSSLPTNKTQKLGKIAKTGRSAPPPSGAAPDAIPKIDFIESAPVIAAKTGKSIDASNLPKHGKTTKSGRGIKTGKHAEKSNVSGRGIFSSNDNDDIIPKIDFIESAPRAVKMGRTVDASNFPKHGKVAKSGRGISSSSDDEVIPKIDFIASAPRAIKMGRTIDATTILKSSEGSGRGVPPPSESSDIIPKIDFIESAPRAAVKMGRTIDATTILKSFEGSGRGVPPPSDASNSIPKIDFIESAPVPGKTGKAIEAGNILKASAIAGRGISAPLESSDIIPKIDFIESAPVPTKTGKAVDGYLILKSPAAAGRSMTKPSEPSDVISKMDFIESAPVPIKTGKAVDENFIMKSSVAAGRSISKPSELGDAIPKIDFIESAPVPAKTGKAVDEQFTLKSPAAAGRSISSASESSDVIPKIDFIESAPRAVKMGRTIDATTILKSSEGSGRGVPPPSESSDIIPKIDFIESAPRAAVKMGRTIDATTILKSFEGSGRGVPPPSDASNSIPKIDFIESAPVPGKTGKTIDALSTLKSSGVSGRSIPAPSTASGDIPKIDFIESAPKPEKLGKSIQAIPPQDTPSGGKVIVVQKEITETKTEAVKTKTQKVETVVEEEVVEEIEDVAPLKTGKGVQTPKKLGRGAAVGQGVDAGQEGNGTSGSEVKKRSVDPHAVVTFPKPLSNGESRITDILGSGIAEDDSGRAIIRGTDKRYPTTPRPQPTTTRPTQPFLPPLTLPLLPTFPAPRTTAKAPTQPPHIELPECDELDERYQFQGPVPKCIIKRKATA